MNSLPLSHCPLAQKTWSNNNPSLHISAQLHALDIAKGLSNIESCKNQESFHPLGIHSIKMEKSGLAGLYGHSPSISWSLHAMFLSLTHCSSAVFGTTLHFQSCLLCSVQHSTRSEVLLRWSSFSQAYPPSIWISLSYPEHSNRGLFPFQICQHYIVDIKQHCRTKCISKCTQPHALLWTWVEGI